MHDVTELIRRALALLTEPGRTWSAEEIAERLEVSPRLVLSLPELRPFLGPPGIERYLDWTLRDWLRYHYYVVHQGYRYGRPGLQQTWRGHRLIKNPLDCWVYQEIIARTRPDVLVELGVAFGGSSVFFADVMDLIDHGEVVGVDLTLDRARGVEHPRLTLIEGSSVDPDVVARVHDLCEGKKAMVLADSNHSREHVSGELAAYADLVGVGMYFVVEDTLADVLDLMPVPIEGPLPAVREFLERDARFQQDVAVAERYLMTQAPYGFLVRTEE